MSLWGGRSAKTARNHRTEQMATRSISTLVDDALLVEARAGLRLAQQAVESSERSVEVEAARLAEVRSLVASRGFVVAVAA